MGGSTGGGDRPTRHVPGVPSVIRALCPNCREVDVAAGEAQLEIFNWIDEATCRFHCPSCRAPVEKPVAPPLVPVLIDMGVRYRHRTESPPPPPPLTAADLERFRKQLAALDG